MLPSALWVAAWAAALSTNSAGMVCSLAPFAETRSSSTTYLLGTASPDTVFAGPGTVRPSEGPGHWGGGSPRRIFGQLVEVQRFAGADSLVLADAFQRRGTRTVVIVPWDYDPSCRTAIWSGSARWIRSSEPGAFSLRMRPLEHWVGTIPTFDAYTADLEPYPHAAFFRAGFRGTDALTKRPSLSAVEYFELTQALPDHAVLREERDRALAGLRTWVRANPSLAARYPADEILAYLGLQQVP